MYCPPALCRCPCGIVGFVEPVELQSTWLGIGLLSSRMSLIICDDGIANKINGIGGSSVVRVCEK